MSSLKAYKYKLYPTKKQAARLQEVLDLNRELYNAALQERKDAYRMAHVSIGYNQQTAQLPEIKEIRPEYADIHSQILQDTLRRVDKAFKAFFRRVKNGEKPGYPRFQQYGRYNSFTFPQSGFSLTEDNRVCLSKIGTIKLKIPKVKREDGKPVLSLPQGKIKTCAIKREGQHWFIVFTCEVEQELVYHPSEEAVGIDLGLLHFATLSDGSTIENPRHFRASEQKLKKLQRALSRKKRGSKRRRKAAQVVGKNHRHIRNQRKDFHHKEARKLVNTYQVIVFEKLQPANMSKRPKPKQDENGTYLPNGASAKSGLNKSILEAGWGQFQRIVVNKAEWASSRVVSVSPKYTSQMCSDCGAIVQKELEERRHECSCGCSLDRDHNAAINIERAGLFLLEKESQAWTVPLEDAPLRSPSFSRGESSPHSIATDLTSCKLEANMEEKKKYQQCAGPNCTNVIEQVNTGRGHRQRLYCHKNCCMAATRERQRLAALEADRQQRLELMRLEKEALRTRFGDLSDESIDLLYQLRHDYATQGQVGKALAAERLTPGPAVEKSLGEYAGEIAELRRELALRTRERDDVQKLAGDATGHTVRWQEKAGEYKHLLKEAEERARNLASQVDDLTNQLAEASQGEAQAARIAVLEHDLTQTRKQASPALLANISELEQKIASLQPKKLRAKIDELEAKSKDLEAERDQAMHVAEQALADLKAADTALSESEAKLRWQEEANHALASSRNEWMQKASQQASLIFQQAQQKQELEGQFIHAQDELLHRAEQAEQALASARAQLDKSASETPEEVSRLRARLADLWRENQEYEAKLAQVAAEQNAAPRIA